ncbi:MAG: hypothetical protein JJE25_02920 [Bacteroidia bacterium]|nr:hypothetical protein [Bacteroidia bacterium]
MKISFSLLLTVFICISLFATGQIKKNKYAINDKTFTIQLKLTSGERKGWQWAKDEISFKAGMLRSKVMSKKEEFPSAKCIFTNDSGSANTISFEANHKNTGVSNIKWQGKVEGDKIEGTAELTNIRGTFIYSFSGTWKGKKK